MVTDGAEAKAGPLGLLPGGGVRVLDLSAGIAGGYCSKLLADAGADVVIVEPEGGSPLRRWSSTGGQVDPESSGAIFSFLHASKRSITGKAASPHVHQLAEQADVVVIDAGADMLAASGLLGIAGLVVVAITPYGHSGPWAERPSADLVVQAESGCISGRGVPGAEPFSVGGRVFDFVAGGYAATAGLAAGLAARRHGRGEFVDVSILESAAIASFAAHVDLDSQLAGLGRDDVTGPSQWVEAPSIEPTSDGWVGFTTNSRQQFEDFLVLIERTDLLEDERFLASRNRRAHFEEWNEIVHAWTTRQRAGDVIEKAAALRIPVAPIGNAETVARFPQFVERGVFVENPSGGFVQPRCPYRMTGVAPPTPGPVPSAGQHTDRIDWSEAPVRGRSAHDLPLAGVKVIDMTSWFAGPLAGQILGLLGADVVHVESTTRIDGMRTTGGFLAERFSDWWECSPQYLSINANKRDLTLDLQTPEGKEALLRLVSWADVLVENFTPRVMDNFGFTWRALAEVNPNLIMVRMPAFGLDGPWRDWTGFAQTMEQVTGLAWITGHTDDQPRIQRGPCDIVSGVHAAYAALVALALRETNGAGVHVESTMVEAALNAAAEQIVEFGAYGNLMDREGNRSPWAAPQGLYRTADGKWMALSVESEAEWSALCSVLGTDGWKSDPGLSTHFGRRDRSDSLDGVIREWVSARPCDGAVRDLVTAGVPAGTVFDQRFIGDHEQLAARGFFEEITHPVVGTRRVAGPPFRYSSVGRWLTRPAPLLGQHNLEILSNDLGLSGEEAQALADKGVVGTRPKGL